MEGRDCAEAHEDVAIRVASWNIAAVNNNPFEYWVTVPDPAYNHLMQAVEEFLCDPQNDDFISSMFNDAMFEELCREMKDQGISHVSELQPCWFEDFRKRKFISGFLRDASIGEKRLVSMPDRITNTITRHDGSKLTRPTAINAYSDGPLISTEAWWTQWKQFMFHTNVKIVSSSSSGNNEQKTICKLIGPILRSKYPAVTVEEQEISIPLQILCLAILDSVFVFILNNVAPCKWENIRQELCQELIHGKESGVSRIIHQSYQDIDVFFIQEAAAILVERIREHHELNMKFLMLVPQDLDGQRNQNSFILVDRKRFVEGSARDVTNDIQSILEGAWVTAGDLFVMSIEDRTGVKWLLASFHGDSNGLSTQPVMTAVNEAARTVYKDHIFLMGLDANTQSVVRDRFHKGVEGFCRFLREHDMVSLWDVSQGSLMKTSCSTRTFLQPQLNKAVPFAKRSKNVLGT